MILTGKIGIRHASERSGGLVNLHCHILPGVDDGAEDMLCMKQMLERSASDGVEYLCLTPHYGCNRCNATPQQVNEAFAQADAYAKKHIPNLHLMRGNEIFYRQQTVTDLRAGHCCTLNQTRYVLVEFWPDEEYQTMQSALLDLTIAGFQPVLAHAERYRCLAKPEHTTWLHQNGVLLQINATTVLTSDRVRRRWLRGMLDLGLVDLVADDCHNLTGRPPGLSAAYEKLAQKRGKPLAQRLFVDTPKSILLSEKFDFAQSSSNKNTLVE